LPDQVHIRLCDLTYIYNQGKMGERKAVDGINADIVRGDFIAVVGSNGSGKSTLAKLINALLVPSSGHVEVNGLDTRRPGNVFPVRQEVGMVFQNPDNQIVAAIVEEDIAFGPGNLGVNAEEMKRRVDAAIKAVGLEQLRYRPSHFLSGGQKQKLAIASALAMKAGCLVLDEPTAMLDASGREQLLRILFALNSEEQITIILITQFMEEAALARSVWVLSEGRLLFSGTPPEVFARSEELNACGLELPAPVEMARRLRESGWLIPDGVLSVDDLVAALKEYRQNRRGYSL